MIKPDARHEELLRHAMHTAADLVEPAGDGLERIRRRVTARHAYVRAGRLTAAHAGPAGPGRSSLRALLAWFQRALGPVRRRYVHGSSAPAPRRVAGLRPSTVVTITALLVAAAALSVSDLPQIIANPAGIVSPLFGNPPAGTGGPSGNGGLGTKLHHKPPASGPGGGAGRSRAPTGSACSPSGPAQQARTPSPTFSPLPPSPSQTPSSPPPSPSPTPSSTSPSVSPSPTQSPSPSPGPSSSDSPDPGASTTPPATGTQVTASPSPAMEMAAVNEQLPGPPASPQPCATGRTSSAPLPGGGRKGSVPRPAAQALVSPEPRPARLQLM